MTRLPTVRDLMDTDFVVLRPDMSVAEAIDILLEHRITGAAVVDQGDQLVGLLSERDCLQTLLRGAYDQTPSGLVSDYMDRDFATVSPETDVFELAEMYVNRVNRRFLVVHDGKLVGQITRRDLLRFIQKFSG
jgi:CBS domain-containing protein